MVRGFVAGLFWGLVLAAVGLAVLSQTVPLPQGDAPQAAATPAAADPAPAAPKQEIVPEILAKGAAPEPAPEPASEPAPEPAVEPATTPPAQPDVTAPQAPAAPEQPAATPTPTPSPAPQPAPATDAPALAPLPGAKDTTPAADPAPASPAAATKANPATAAPEPTAKAAPAPEPAAATAAPGPGKTPLEVFARPFDAPPSLPLFALVLVDPGTPGLDRAALAALPFPVSFVIDPQSPAAAAAASTYRAAGQEVLMQAPALAADTPASEVAQSFQRLDLALPQAVALADLSGGLVMGDLGRAVLPILTAQGRGLLTLNQALARTDLNLPVMTIFASLDAAAGPDQLRQSLDSAATQARKDGRAVLALPASPQMAALLRDWAAGPTAAPLALAPVSATLAPR